MYHYNNGTTYKKFIMMLFQERTYFRRNKNKQDSRCNHIKLYKTIYVSLLYLELFSIIPTLTRRKKNLSKNIFLKPDGAGIAPKYSFVMVFSTVIG